MQSEDEINRKRTEKAQNNRVNIDGSEKVYPATQSYKQDHVTGWPLKHAHLQCPVQTQSGEEVIGHVHRTYFVEGYQTLLCPTQMLQGMRTMSDGRQVPNIVPCSSDAKNFDYFTKK